MSTKLPVVGKASCITLTAVVVLVIVIIGLAIGLGVQRRSEVGPTSSSLTEVVPPAYIFVSNNSGSCPPLVADRLLTQTRLIRGVNHKILAVILQSAFTTKELDC